MAALLTHVAGYCEEMVKYKLIFSLVFLFAIQLAGFSTNLSKDSIPVSGTNEIESSFEANDSLPNIFGDIPSGQVSVHFSNTGTDFFSGNTKSKEVLSGYTASMAQSKLQFGIAQSSIFTRSSAVFIPIYLQTASFLL